MKVILNCLPPSDTSSISAALSILQSFLKKHKVNVETKYWNFLFTNALTHFQMENGSLLHLLPFLSHVALQYNDKQALENIEIKLQASNPQYVNISKTYYTEVIANFSDTVYSTFTKELKTMCIEECSLFGISSKFFQWIPGNIVAELVKQINPDTKIVIGGFGTRQEAMALMQNFSVYDYAVWGEGEYALLGLCRHIENPEENPIQEVQHLVYRENETLQATQIKSEYLDLNSINPDFSDYFNQKKNIADPLVPIEGGRGCHWRKCKFCFLNSGYNNRCKNVDKVASFIESTIEEYNVNSFCFVDNDMINNDVRSFSKLLDSFITLRQKHPKFAINNAEIVTKGLNAEIIKKMSFAGIKVVQIGYEAINDVILKKINKKNTLSSNILFVKWARQFNIDFFAVNIITNLIGETDTEIIDSIKNLHFLRFYLKKNSFQHEFVALEVATASPYYKLLKQNNLLDKWNRCELAEFLPQAYINDKINRFDIFLLSKETTNPLWRDFRETEQYYLNNSYWYQIIEKDADTFFYQEFCNSTLVKQLELEKDSMYWKILCLCNRQVVSKQEIMECLNDFSQEIEDTIRELFDEYLLYTNDDLSEVVSLINTDIIYH